MIRTFSELLKRHGVVENPNDLAGALELHCSQLAKLLAGCNPVVREQIIAHLGDIVLDQIHREITPENPDRRQAEEPGTLATRKSMACDWQAESQGFILTPAYMELMRHDINEEEIVADLQEIRRTGGLELREFIHELESEMTSRE